MKPKLILILILLSISSAFAQEKMKVAVLPVFDEHNTVMSAHKQVIRSGIVAEITNSDGYIAIEMGRVDAIIDVAAYNESGLLKESERIQLGEIFGANYILKIEVIADDLHIIISAYLLELETGVLVQGGSVSEYCEKNIPSIQEACAKMIHKLFGKKTSSVNDLPSGLISTKGSVPVSDSEFSADYDYTLVFLNNQLLTATSGKSAPFTWSNTIQTVDICKEGKKIVQAFDDNTAKVWSLETGEILYVLWENPSPGLPSSALKFQSDPYAFFSDDLSGRINHVEFSNDGKLILAAYRNGNIVIFDAENGRAQKKIEAHNSEILKATFNNNNTMILSYDGTNTVKLWDAQSGSLIKDYGQHNDRINEVIFTNDGTKFLISSKGTASLYNSSNGKLLFTFKIEDDNYVVFPVFSKDDKTLVYENTSSALSTKSLDVWTEQRNGKWKLIMSYKFSENFDNFVVSIDFYNDDKEVLLLTEYFDKEEGYGVIVRSIDIKTGEVFVDNNISGLPSKFSPLQMAIDKNRIVVQNHEGLGFCFNTLEVSGSIIWGNFHTDVLFHHVFAKSGDLYVTFGINETIVFDGDFDVLYTRYQLSENDWLIHSQQRQSSFEKLYGTERAKQKFHGTEGAKQKAYFNEGLYLFPLELIDTKINIKKN